MNPKTMVAARTIGLLLAALAAGCAGPNAPARETSAQSAPILAPPRSPQVAADTIAPEPPAAQAQADPEAAALPLPPAANSNHSTPAAPAASAPKSPKPSALSSAAQGTSKAAERSPGLQAKAAPTAPSATPPLTSEAPVPTARPVAPTLDVADLKTRLRETHAIGTFTKIALKNQMDDLLQQFRAVYEGGNRTRVASLRQPFDTLVLKVLSVVKEGDPSLAQTISASREAIWGILSDPVKFKSVS